MIISPNLPVHICKETQADQVYDKHAGTELLGVSTCIVFAFVQVALILNTVNRPFYSCVLSVLALD